MLLFSSVSFTCMIRKGVGQGYGYNRFLFIQVTSKMLWELGFDIRYNTVYNSYGMTGMT